ncbi:MAG: hypothetical protein KAR40_11280 [Candidatus Sabulitectum sp.]|nr:hypothetical protein [Candidatus Sabulitectum sp.]
MSLRKAFEKAWTEVYQSDGSKDLPILLLDGDRYVNNETNHALTLFEAGYQAALNEPEWISVDARRYKYVRTLNVQQFGLLYQRNISDEGSFDSLVDAAITLRERTSPPEPCKDVESGKE